MTPEEIARQAQIDQLQATFSEGVNLTVQTVNMSYVNYASGKWSYDQLQDCLKTAIAAFLSDALYICFDMQEESK
jgi:hypothetical protein